MWGSPPGLRRTPPSGSSSRYLLRGMGKSVHTLHNGLMSAAYLAVAVLLFAPSLEAQSTQSTLAPSYSTASIANAATNLPSGFAPNSIISIYGTNLAFDTVSGTAPSGYLPQTLAGVAVYVDSWQANLFYVSPRQINALLPYSIVAGVKTITVLRQGTSGPPVQITLTATAPGLFQLTPANILATHADSSVITSSSPATAGEVIVIYAVGLGPTTPKLTDGLIPTTATELADFSTFSVLLNGAAVDPATIQYAGVTPGCAGLYQINVQLPSPLPSNPEIRVAVGPQISPALMTLPTQ
jgi:uncharacterized protein (TIGR03437 family)